MICPYLSKFEKKADGSLEAYEVECLAERCGVWNAFFKCCGASAPYPKYR